MTEHGPIVQMTLRPQFKSYGNYDVLSPCHTRAASSRRLHGVQEKLRTPRCAQWDLLERRGIAVASPWHLRWTPWGLLGRHATARTLCMHKVRAVARRSHGDLNERRVNAVGSQRQRSNSAVRSPRAPRRRRAHAVGTHMIAARTPPYTTIIRECNEGIKKTLTNIGISISKTLFSAILFD